MVKKPHLLFINVERNYGIKGTIRKAFAQYQALQEIFSVDFIYIKRKLYNRWIRAIFFYVFFPIEVLLKALSHKGCFIYYRYYPHNIFLNIIIYLIRKINRIYVEVNTKYKFETKNTNKWFYLSNLLSENLVYRSSAAVLPVTEDMGNYVKYIYPNSRIIVLGNGYDPIDFDDDNKINYDDLTKLLERGENKRKFIWVGTPFFWHGLDKIIHIISQLDNACLYLAGNYNKINEYVSSNTVLYNNIYNIGERKLNELQFFYENVEYGIGSFGLERLNIKDGAPLKVREYLYYGLPVIIGYHDSQLAGLEFVHQYSNLEYLKEFLNKKYDRTKIKQYARQYLSWKPIMKKIFEPEVNKIMSSGIDH